MLTEGKLNLVGLNCKLKLNTGHGLGATSWFGLIKELTSQNVFEVTQIAGLHVGKKV